MSIDINLCTDRWSTLALNERRFSVANLVPLRAEPSESASEHELNIIDISLPLYSLCESHLLQFIQTCKPIPLCLQVCNHLFQRPSIRWRYVVHQNDCPAVMIFIEMVNYEINTRLVVHIEIHICHAPKNSFETKILGDCQCPCAILTAWRP